MRTVSAFISDHVLEKQGKLKKVSVLMKGPLIGPLMQP